MGLSDRKGIGYSIEAIAAMFILLAFAATAFQIPSAAQDWRDYQRQIAAHDLGYTLQRTGHLSSFMKRGDTGALRTSVVAISSRELKVSGTVSNLPILETQIGYHTLPDKRFTQPLYGMSGGSCEGGLEEIKSKSEAPVLRTASSDTLTDLHEVKLYFADTDPKHSGGGFDGTVNYDSVWVDNGTACQFSAAEGPHYLHDFFFWGNSTGPGETHFYDFKSINGNARQFTVYRADQVIRMRETMRKGVNGVDTDTTFDTFRFSGKDITVYDLVVFRRAQSLDNIQNHRTELENFMEKGSVLLAMNPSQSQVTSGFIADTGLKWVDLGYSSPPGGSIAFTETPLSSEVETYFVGQKGDNSAVTLSPGAKISSSPGPQFTTREVMVYSPAGRYDTDEWNATNMNMNPTNTRPPGAPDTYCGEWATGSFSFPTGTYDMVNTHLGTSASACNKLNYGINIDRNGDGDYGDIDEGPFLNGEVFTVEGRRYRLKTYPTRPGCDDGLTCAEMVYAGAERVEVVNFRTTFSGFDGTRLARVPYEPSYSQADRRLVASIIYWLRGDQKTFSGRGEPVAISTSIAGSIKNITYMPYQLHLRWRN
ncbi:MAG: hypothetical protein ABEJ75_03155 [Candidatus Nanohaloarchaea archaeon]